MFIISETTIPLTNTGFFEPTLKAQHCSFIKAALETIDTSNGRDVKAVGAKMLYDYLYICAMDFINTYDRFKVTAITKAYELKKMAPEQTSMVESINRLLTALNKPLEETCPDQTLKVDNKPIEPIEPIKHINIEYNIFVLIAKRLKYNTIIKDPQTYYKYYQDDMRRGAVKGLSIAEKIENYIFNDWDYAIQQKRIKLMKDLFMKNNLTFTEDVMDLYDEWVISVKPTNNRYIKMCKFIDEHKDLFDSS